MRSAALVFAAGVWWCQQQEILIARSWSLAGIAAGIAFVILSFRMMFSWRRAVVQSIAALIGGFCWTAFLASVWLQHLLPDEWEHREIVLVGVIDGLPERHSQGVNFPFRVEQARGADAPSLDHFPKRIALSWYRPMSRATTTAVPDIHPGQRWRLKVRLKRLHGLANIFGPDPELAWMKQGVGATGYIHGGGQLASENAGGVMTKAHRLRQSVRARVERLLDASPARGVLVALLIGQQSAIDAPLLVTFRATGTSHLVAISGLHIGLIAGFIALLSSFVWRRAMPSWRLPEILPAPRVASLIAVFAGGVYLMLAGAGVPAQRAFILLIAVAIGYWTRQRASSVQRLALAFIVVLAMDPASVLSAGLWLSFGAVAAILSVVRSYNHSSEAPSRWNKLVGVMRIQWAVTVALIPLLAYMFGQVSLVSPMANAFAIPVVGMMVTPLAMLAICLPDFLAGPLLKLAHEGMSLVIWALERSAAMPMAVWRPAQPAPWMVVCAILAVIGWLGPWRMMWRILGSFGWLPLLLVDPDRPASGQYWLTAFDVGQGMAVLIETSHHRLLYDTGAVYSPESDAGSRVIVPHLRAVGASRLDRMVISHADIDHAGGAKSVLQSVAVESVYSSLPERHWIVQSAGKPAQQLNGQSPPAHTSCRAGQRWEWDGVVFEMLHPDESQAALYGGYPQRNTNALSCVLKVGSGARATLLAGDIGVAQERYMVGRQRSALDAAVLLAPHHGSRSSSSEGFLSAVKPRHVLVQAGYLNRFGHPHAQISQRYRNIDAIAWRTDQCGAVRMRFENEISVTAVRRQKRRYWHAESMACGKEP